MRWKLWARLAPHSQLRQQKFLKDLQLMSKYICVAVKSFLIIMVLSNLSHQIG